MPKIENKILDFIRQYIPWIFIFFLVAAACFVRVWLIDVMSSDMELFLLPWYREFEAGGFEALYTHSGNYNVPYMLFVYLATLIPLPPVAAIKLFSYLGDLLLAWGVAFILWQLLPKGRFKPLFAVIGFCAALLLPSVVLNSAYWGQCDALYTGFLLIAVYFMLRDKWIWAFVFVGIGLCFKLQAVFILPALIVLYATKRRFSVLHFLLLPAILLLSAAPVIIHNQDLLAPFRVYAEQAGTNYGAYVNYHNLSSVLAQPNEVLFVAPLLVFAVLVWLGMLALAMVKKLDFSGENLLLLAAWSAMSCVVLLPRMHERYAFAAEMLLLLWFVIRPSAQRFVPAITFYVIGFLACARFVLPGSIWPGQSIWLGLLNVACFVFITWLLLRTVNQPERINKA